MALWIMHIGWARLLWNVTDVLKVLVTLYVWTVGMEKVLLAVLSMLRRALSTYWYVLVVRSSRLCIIFRRPPMKAIIVIAIVSHVLLGTSLS